MSPSFSIYGEAGYKVPTLKACFIESKTLQRDKLPANFVPSDGVVYKAVYDCRIPEAESFEAIISYQQHTYGNFAVVRVNKDKKK
jgi:hypothetical protein